MVYFRLTYSMPVLTNIWWRLTNAWMILLILPSALKVHAQTGSMTDTAYYRLLTDAFNGGNAYKTVEFVEQRWRLAGNTGFSESIAYVEKILLEAGYKKEVRGEAEGPLTYRIERRKMSRPTWEPINASLVIAGETTPVLQFSSNRNMVAINSSATAAEGETAEVLYVGKGEARDFEGKDLRGKIALGDASPASLYNRAINAGAIGVLVYSIPGLNQPEKYPNNIPFQAIAAPDSFMHKWAILLSYAARKKLLATLATGRLMVTVKVSSRIYWADELTIIANALGNKTPQERFLFSAHVQEPGANDNASGVGTLAEMARVTAQLVNQKKYLPQRTISFLWGDEIVSTRRYIREDMTRAKGIKWGLSLDMVGEDVSKTGGSFLIEKMPDPAAIWTRGAEKHTEWGGSPLKESDLFPHYFNDLVLNICRQHARQNGWPVKVNPFEGGSDHEPFLEAGIPGLLMWHFTDVFYHTDADRLEMVSEAEMKNVGVAALETALTLASANENTTLRLVNDITKTGLDRLDTEYELSKLALLNSSSIPHEKHILTTWANWYKGAISAMKDICTCGLSPAISSRIKRSVQLIEERNKALGGSLF